MRLLLSTALLGLAWFAAVNLVMSALAWCASRAVLRRGTALSGAALLTLRLLPSAAALVFAAAVFAPAHVRFEPAQSDEQFGLTLMAFAGLGSWLLARSARRAARVAAVARVAGRWPVQSAASRAGDAYEISGLRGVSLAGVFHPRILIGRGARRVLTPDELDLAIAHERAHRHALDNLKRCAMFCAPDLFGGTATAASLEARWRARAERDADDRAVAGDERRALHLASALLKVARLGGRAAEGPARPPLWSTFNEPPLLEERVRSLLARPVRRPPAWRDPSRAAVVAAWGLAAAAWLVHAPYDVHLLTELFVAVLP